MKNWNIYIGLTGMTAGLILSCCTRTGNSPETIIRTARIDTVRLSTVTEQSVYPGKVRAAADVSLSFRVAGTLERLLCAEGDFVSRGTTLAELDARDYRVQLAATEAEYRQVKAEAERIAELYRRQSVAKSDYEKAIYGLEQITAKYDSHKNQLADARLRAPFDGHIREKLRSTGETVAAGMPVLSMLGAGEWQIEISLPVKDYVRREEFDRFEAVISTAPDSTFTLEPLNFSSRGNAAQLYKMRFRIRRPGTVALAAGMSVEVTAYHKTKDENRCEIPLSAMFERNGQPHVWVFTSESEPPQARLVSVGEVRRSGKLVIREGLRQGELIIVAGVHSITGGMRVKPLPAVSQTNIGGLL
jgi:RND family efflux transporter MFP subunit